jgi:hypothetical protein
LVDEIREPPLQHRGLGPFLTHRRRHPCVAGSQISECDGREPTFTLRAALADLLHLGVGVEGGEVFELLSRPLNAELGAQPVEHVPPRLLVGLCE